jgi:hypothetical protein
MGVSSIEVSALKVGDVLLAHRDDVISDIIRLIDGGSFSHAGLFDGNDVVEAGPGNIERTPLQTFIDGHKYVDAYRYHTLGRKPMTLLDMVARRAHHYLDTEMRYADNQLYLTGTLILTKRQFTRVRRSDFDTAYRSRLWLLFTRMEKTPLQTAFKEVFELFRRIADGDEEKPVVCSEFIYRSFHEAGRGIETPLSWRRPPYLEIVRPPPADFRSMLARHFINFALDTEYKDLLDQCKILFFRINPTGSLAADSDIAADMITPRDLEESPSLRLIGRLVRSTSPERTQKL